jgi:hypothetical protein
VQPFDTLTVRSDAPVPLADWILKILANVAVRRPEENADEQAH